MSDLLTAAAQALGAPESIVQRSAEARAKATGASPEEVLQAWAGGGSVATAAPPAPPGTAAAAEAQPDGAQPDGAQPDVAQPESAPAPPAEVPRPAPAPEAPAGEGAAAVPSTVVVEPEEEPFEAAPLRERVRHSGRIGALVGLVVGLLSPLVGAAWLLPRATLAGPEEALAPAVEVVPGWLVGGHVLLALAAGAAVAGVARTFTGWSGRGMRLVSSFGATVAWGAVGGALVGLLVGGVVVGSGEASQAVEGLQVIPVVPLLVWVLLGWTAGGWAIGALVQAVGVPDGVEPEEAEEVGAVRRRLASAYGIPVVALVSILALVLPLAYLFISFPGYAPLLGILVAGGILGFAGLSASRPGMRISAGEFLVAAAGIGVVVLVIVAVLTAQGAGHSEEPGSEEPPPEAAALLPT